MEVLTRMQIETKTSYTGCILQSRASRLLCRYLQALDPVLDLFKAVFAA